MHGSRRLRQYSAIGLFAAALATTSLLISAQGAAAWRERSFVPTASVATWTGTRAPDGQPDVAGHWSNTIGNHNNLTDPQGPLGGDDTPGGGRQGGARGERPRSDRAPSRVSDPADGQVPFQPWARAKQQEFLRYLNNPIREEYVEPFARCAPGGPTKSFMWHGYEIRQYPGYVIFLFDSGNRVIHLDNKPHLPASLKLWQGDSRGRWEGNTLVVSTTNNNSKARLGRTGEFVSQNATIDERFIFDPGGQRFTYEATYVDPTVLTRPFTITIPNRRITAETVQDDWNNLTFRARHTGSEPIIEAYERICAEGNGNHGFPAAVSR